MNLTAKQARLARGDRESRHNIAGSGARTDGVGIGFFAISNVIIYKRVNINRNGSTIPAYIHICRQFEKSETHNCLDGVL